jgi:hypothetical protein
LMNLDFEFADRQAPASVGWCCQSVPARYHVGAAKGGVAKAKKAG